MLPLITSLLSWRWFPEKLTLKLVLGDYFIEQFAAVARPRTELVFGAAKDTTNVPFVHITFTDWTKRL